MFPDNGAGGCCAILAISECSRAIGDEASRGREHIIDPRCLVLLAVTCPSDASSTDGRVGCSNCSFSAAFSECSTSSGAGNANGGC